MIDTQQVDDTWHDRGWSPEPRPTLMLSKMRFRIRRTARGWALYDHALGTRVSFHPTKEKALYWKQVETDRVRALRAELRDLT